MEGAPAEENHPEEIRHKVDHLIITCLDSYCQDDVLKKQQQLGIKPADMLTTLGASKAVAEGIHNNAIITSYQRHGFEIVHIIDHTDCDGFNGFEAYGFDEKAEADAHFRTLKRAREVVQRILPHMTVVEYVLGINGEEIKPGSDPRIGPSHSNLERSLA